MHLSSWFCRLCPKKSLDLGEYVRDVEGAACVAPAIFRNDDVYLAEGVLNPPGEIQPIAYFFVFL